MTAVTNPGRIRGLNLPSFVPFVMDTLCCEGLLLLLPIPLPGLDKDCRSDALQAEKFSILISSKSVEFSFFSKENAQKIINMKNVLHESHRGHLGEKYQSQFYW